jgi:hypothetical protein
MDDHLARIEDLAQRCDLSDLFVDDADVASCCGAYGEAD